LALSDYLLDRLAEGLLGLAEELEDFHVVDTRKKLIRAALGTTGDDADWLNEFHPNSDGYIKMAKALEPVLNRLLQ
jgi:lysophospholipase L1-like esterase